MVAQRGARRSGHVGDDAVDGEVRERPDTVALVHGPDVHGQPRTVDFEWVEIRTVSAGSPSQEPAATVARAQLAVLGRDPWLPATGA